ncbi:MAG TPA: lasso peptide biosynthesis B2 protein [Longimicrobium sp.]|nr:lasso peptide biosynthesis B2 protein [Longimicrobium sp.]
MRRPRPEWRLLAAAVALLPLFRLMLLMGPFEAVHRHARAAARRSAAPREEVAAAVGWAVAAAARRLPFASCLSQALAVQFLLARRGIESTLWLGARRTEVGRFSAHAWVRCGGRFVIGGPTEGFSLFPPLP